MPRISLLTILAVVALAAALAAPAGADRSRVRADPRPAGYADAERELRRDGRGVAALVAAGDADALFARFTPALAREVPIDALRTLLQQALAAGPVGARLGERVLPAAADRRDYAAEHRQGGGAVRVELSLRADDTIQFFRIEPVTPLPPDPAVDHRLRARLRLPVSGTWWVYWGGPDELRNYHAATPAQRHAYDLVQWRRGGTARGAGRRNRDYHAWDRRVVAPAAGIVRVARDGVRDNRPQVETNRRAPAGNHVVLDLGADEYALLGHLRHGSVRVRVGQRVRAGAPLGRVGNSGNSSEPHLHFHLQDGADLDAGTGLPVVFRHVSVDRDARRRATPVQGQFVAPARR